MAELFTPADDVRSRRPDKTYSKHIMLTEFGREKIEAWAKTNGLNFSAAIETLALMGLDDERSAYAISMVKQTRKAECHLVEKTVREMRPIAIEAAASRTMSESIMLQLIREMAVEHPDDYVTMMNISRDGCNQLY